jgi:Domain of Unknown Function (DUF928)
MKAVRLGAILVTLLGTITISFAEAAEANRFVPKRRGMPGRREGGGTRGACAIAKNSLTAMMPKENFGRTTAAHPTLYWYAPATQSTQAEIVLLSEQGEEVYSRQLPISGKSGLISFTLPQKEMKGLEVGKTYRWKFALICDPENPSTHMITEGWIQRVNPTAELQAKLASTSAEQQPNLYLQSDLWYDAVGSLVKLRQAQPNQPETKKIWKQLLEQEALPTIAAH